jgi:hypothetical protein
LARGAAAALEWRVTNLSAAEVELVLEEPAAKRLKAAGPSGPVSLPAPPATGRRSVRLGPGEHVGGTFAELPDRLAAPGRYQVAWAAAISWNGKPVALPAAPLPFERR